jgi:hypothetical protein
LNILGSMKYTILSLLLALSPLLIRCSKPVSEVRVESYFTQGDPKTIVEGTTMETKGIPVESYKNFDGFFMNQVYFFQQKSPIKSQQEVLKNQAGTGKEQVKSVTFSESRGYSFSEFIDNGKTKYAYANKENKLEIIFTAENGFLKAEKIQDGEGNMIAVSPTLQHISVSKDKATFSILLYIDIEKTDAPSEDNSKELIAFYFTKPYEWKLDLVESGNFDYMLGKNIKLFWQKDQKVTLGLCNPNLVSKKEQINLSLKSWTQYIKSPTFNVQFISNPPPFSDLNTHCIYIVDNYLTRATPGFSNPAVTLMYARNNIEDQDILLYEKEINKFQGSVLGNDREWADPTLWMDITHEIGHFLGLGHPINLMHPEFQSIMSYSDDVVTHVPFEHDIEAITALYK